MAVILGGPNRPARAGSWPASRGRPPRSPPYPFTTHVPIPGMMPWEDVTVQLIDTRAYHRRLFMEPYIARDHPGPGADVGRCLMSQRVWADDDGIECHAGRARSARCHQDPTGGLR